ncbi:MAG: DUF413 domain-containing protein [Planctomycetota bacterium]
MTDQSPFDLTPEEEALLERYYAFYRTLDTGGREPTTAAQHHFVAVCHGIAKANTIHEQAYVKYRMLLAKARAQASEAGDGEIDEFGEGVPRPGWFTDEGWKRMRGHYLSNSD